MEEKKAGSRAGEEASVPAVRASAREARNGRDRSHSHSHSMAMDPTFRWATEKDAGAILGLVRELTEFEKELDKVKTTEADFARDLSLGHFVCVLAVVNEKDTDQAVGMALLHNRYSTWDGLCVHLEDLYVKPEHRLAGVGKRLIECCVKHARETGRRRLCGEVSS